MDAEAIYENIERRVIEDTTGRQTQNNSKDEGKDGKRRGSGSLVLITGCLGLICVLLLIFIILQFIAITAEKDLVKSYKNTAEDLQNKNTDLMTEKDQLNNRFNSLNQKKLELERNVTFLSEELKTTSNRVCFFKSDARKSWKKSRQFCRDRGADLIIIDTEEKQRFITSFIKERVWIGLTDKEKEGRMKWVDDSTLNQPFWAEGEPNNYEKEDCIELNPKRGRVRNWNDNKCSEKLKGLCENKVSPESSLLEISYY